MRRPRRRSVSFRFIVSSRDERRPGGENRDHTPALQRIESVAIRKSKWRAAHARHSRRSTSDSPEDQRRWRCDGSSPVGWQAARRTPRARAEPRNLHEAQDSSPDIYARFAQARRAAAFPSDPARRRQEIRREMRNDRMRRLLDRRMHARNARRPIQEVKTIARKRRRRRMPHEIPDAWRATVT